MKFKLQAIDDYGTVIVHEFEVGTWYDSLNKFVNFLRGAGYTLQNDSVGINLDAGHLFIGDDEYNNITFFGQES